MSGTSEDKLDPAKGGLPLDLAAKLTSVKTTVDVKAPLIMSGGQAATIRGMRVLSGGGTTTAATASAGQAAAPLMPGGQVPKQQGTAAAHQLMNAGQSGGTALPANVTLHRPAQITLATSLSAQASSQGGATYHVPRGPAVVANLSAPRGSNVASIRSPLVVRDGTILSPSGGGPPNALGIPGGHAGLPPPVHQFGVRPTRTPSPAQNPAAGAAAGTVTAAWLTSVSAASVSGNGSIQPSHQHYQIGGGKGAIVQQQQQLIAPIRSVSVGGGSMAATVGPLGGATITPTGASKGGGSGGALLPASLVVTRTQPGAHLQQQPQAQVNATTLATIRPTIFHSTLPLSPLHQFKANAAGSAANISNAVTIAQVLPNRTQTLVYSSGNQTHFSSAPRLSIGTSAAPYRQSSAPRSVVTTTRLALPVGAQTGGGARVLAAPQGATVLTTTGVRISAVSNAPHHQLHQPQQPQPLTSLASSFDAFNTLPRTGGPTIAARGMPTSHATGGGGHHAVTCTMPTLGGATLTPAPPPPTSLGGGGRLAAVTVSPANAATLSSLTNNAHMQHQQQQRTTLNLHTLPLVAVASGPPPAPPIAQSMGAGKLLAHQSSAIHLTPMTSTIKASQNIVTTTARTNVNLKAAAIVSQRQSSIVTTQSIPIGKVYPQQGEAGLAQANVYIHTSVPSAPRRASPGVLSVADVPALTTYSILGGSLIHGLAEPHTPSQQAAATYAVAQVTIPTVNRPPIYSYSHMHASAVVSHQQQQHQQQQQQPAKLTSSPRPSILRKRDNEGSPLKAAKNLTPTLNSMQQHQQQQQHLLQQMQQQQQLPLESPRSPHIRPDSRNNGNSSEGGSTTISASSSPGLGENNDEMVSMPMNIIKGEEENRPPPEMSPRKKPRKQNLAGNDFVEHRLDDIQFISEHRDLKKDHQHLQQQPPPHHLHPHLHHPNPHRQQQQQYPDMDGTGGPISDNDAQQQQQYLLAQQVKLDDQSTQQQQQQQQQQLRSTSGKMASERVTPRKPQASLLNSYRQTWKTTNNHYLRYADVKPKDERRPSIMDLSNQYRVLDKVNGWKIHHLSTQMEDLADQEQAVYNQLTELLKYTESREWNSHDKDVNRINELIKGNLQRIKIINDGMIEAKSQIMKIFDHKTHVIDIISRCASKRNYKKREKV